MTTPLAKQASIDRLDSIVPEKTPLYIGKGVVFEGDVRFTTQDPDQRLLIVGELRGNIFTNAVVQIAEGAVVTAVDTVEAGEIVVSGSINGPKVKVKASLMLLQPTGNIEVDTICLPPGGLEQSRGGILNARLDMSKEHGTVPPVRTPVDSNENKPPHSAALKAVPSTGAPAPSLVTATAGVPSALIKDNAGPAPLAGGATFSSVPVASKSPFSSSAQQESASQSPSSNG